MVKNFSDGGVIDIQFQYSQENRVSLCLPYRIGRLFSFQQATNFSNSWRSLM